MHTERHIEADLIVPPGCANVRLDKALAEIMPQYSRAKLVGWLKNGSILIDGVVKEPKSKLKGDEKIAVRATLEAVHAHEAESIPLTVVYEDDDILIVDKPAGQLVHPGAGHKMGTMLNGLLNHVPELINLPRAGIVHRLDKDTTGLLVVAKSLEAHTKLVQDIQDRQIDRHYLALCQGHIISGGTVETMMGRHPVHRKKMAVLENGKFARTHYRVHTRFQAQTLLEVKLDTGRTHQIRVHMAHIGHPVVGDPLYGKKPKFPKGAAEEVRETLSTFKRQALHAYKLALDHPVTGKRLEFKSLLPADYKHLIGVLKNSV